jgi:hypothetical protein
MPAAIDAFPSVGEPLLSHPLLSLPCILAPPSCGPVESGKQVISLLVRPNKATANFVNLESEEKFYTKGRHFCPEVKY